MRSKESTDRLQIAESIGRFDKWIESISVDGIPRLPKYPQDIARVAWMAAAESERHAVKSSYDGWQRRSYDKWEH